MRGHDRPARTRRVSRSHGRCLPRHAPRGLESPSRLSRVRVATRDDRRRAASAASRSRWSSPSRAPSTPSSGPRSTAGATALKPAKKSFWGYGGVVQAPDGTIWKVATSSKKDTGPATREVDEVVLLLGVEDVKATKQFYVDRGLAVGKSFGSKYVEFDRPGSPVKLALYKRRARSPRTPASPPEGSGSHRIVVGGDAGAVHRPGRVRLGGGVGVSRRSRLDGRRREREHHDAEHRRRQAARGRQPRPDPRARARA